MSTSSHKFLRIPQSDNMLTIIIQIVFQERDGKLCIWEEHYKSFYFDIKTVSLEANWESRI